MRLGNARREAERYGRLLKEDAVTRQQYDNVQTAFEAAEARYEQLLRAKRTTSLAKSEQGHRLEQNEAAIRLAEAAVELARLNLSYTVIVAPCDGVTGRRQIDEGQLVQPGQTLLDVVDSGEVWVTANYRETQLPHEVPLHEPHAAHGGCGRGACLQPCGAARAAAAAAVGRMLRGGDVQDTGYIRVHVDHTAVDYAAT